GPAIVALAGNGAPIPPPNSPPPNPPPSKFVLGSADALPIVEHIEPLASVGDGLSPGDVSPVAPMDTPSGGTDEPGVMPSGEVVPIPESGLPIAPTCAKTGLQPKSTVAVAAINARRMVMPFLTGNRRGR